MIKAFATSEAGDVITLGLSKENVNRMLAGHPVRIRGYEINQPQIGAVLIYYGETEADMEQQLREAGLIGPTTTVRNDR